jgi:hypothetical protein
MGSVIIEDCLPSIVWREDHPWYEMIRLFPKNVAYTVMPCSHPNIIPFLRELEVIGARNISLACVDDESYKECRLVQIIEKKYAMRDLGYKAGMRYANAAEVYNDFRDALKVLWFWVPLL